MNDTIAELKEKMSSLGISPEIGLGEDLFLFVSSLVPIVNVDLLVYNQYGHFLLIRREDSHCGNGWHVPGGCIRFKEEVNSRIRKVAETELGLKDFTYEKEPIKVFEIFFKEKREINNQNERAHFITLVYKCFVGDDYVPNNRELKESDAGFIKWFDKLPDDLLKIQQCYKEILE